MKFALLICLLATSVNQPLLAQSSPEKDLLQFERDACKVFLDADPAGLERVLTADFTLTLSNGDLSTRADEISELRSGKAHYDVFENYDMKARLYGDSTAVVLGKTRVKGTAEGEPFDRVVQWLGSSRHEEAVRHTRRPIAPHEKSLPVQGGAIG